MATLSPLETTAVRETAKYTLLTNAVNGSWFAYVMPTPHHPRKLFSANSLHAFLALVAQAEAIREATRLVG